MPLDLPTPAAIFATDCQTLLTRGGARRAPEENAYSG